MTNDKNIDELLIEIEELKKQLFDANNIMDAIKDGSVDALVLNKDGKPAIYSLESADYTYRILIEKFGEGALSIAEDGLILYCNEYFSNLMNLPTNKIVGSYLDSYVQSIDQFQKLKSELINGQSKGEIVLSFNNKNIPVYISVTDLRPSIPALGLIVTDLSEKRKHEEALAIYQRRLEVKVKELNQINSNLEEFVHVISHDIKEPVRKILVYSGYLHDQKQQTFDPDDLKKLNALRSSALRLNSLVEDMVKYSTDTSYSSELTEIDLELILSEVKDDMALLMEDNNAKLKIGDLPKIQGSAVQLRQLFSNLMGNAVKYKQKNKEPVITISSAVADHVDLYFPNKKFYKISVKDNGIGISKNGMDKIFIMFQRLHMQSEYSGNGIGLAICKKIMEIHLGKISVESVEGEGSSFHLFFPMKNQL